VQAVIDGKANHMPHERERADFVLRGFVKCGTCSTPLTSGWAKGRSKLYAYYWCWNKQCRAVKIKKESLEERFVGLLGMMQPTADLIARLPKIAASPVAGTEKSVHTRQKNPVRPTRRAAHFEPQAD